MSDKYVDELLGPMEPETHENEPPVGQIDERSGSEDGPPAIQPLAVDENAEVPPAAYENDPQDLVVESPSQENSSESQDTDPSHVSLPRESGPPIPETPADAAPVDAAPVVDAPPVKPSREEGLRHEIVRLRAELKKNEVAGAFASRPPVQPVPGSYPPGAPGTGIPVEQPAGVPGAQVVVSEDGSTVYLPDEEINRRVAEQVHAAMQPSPMQQAAIANNNMEQAFVASDPARNQPAVQMFRNVDEYLGLKLQALQAGGYQPRSVPELTHTLKVMGVEEEFGQYFPETAPMFDELIAAVSSQQPAWKQSILERMAVYATPGSSEEMSETTPKPLVDVAGMPRSLARKGGTRSQAPTGDKAEFKTLEDGFHKDPVGFPRAQYQRYQELGLKLGEDGFESI